MKTLWSVFGKRLEQLIEEEQEIERSLASANTEWRIQNLTREKKRIVKMREELSPTLKSLAKKRQRKVVNQCESIYDRRRSSDVEKRSKRFY